MRKLFVMAMLISCVTMGSAAGQTLPPGSVHWPSVAQQVAQAGAKHGTALEALIKRYGPASVLNAKLFAQEHNDGRNLPYWLRAYWRDEHPELKCSIVKLPGGGGFDRTYGGCYPLALQDVYEWMVTHQNFDNSSGQGSTDFNTLSLSTGTNIRLSGSQTAPRSESDIRVNYWNPNLIIGASNNISSSGQQAQWYSTDGGQTWNQNYLPLQSGLGDAFMSDPTVDWTSDGTAWATTIGINSGGSVLHMRAYKSTDNGASWGYDATFSGSQTSTDKQMIWTDHSNSSPYKDNIYAIYHNGAPAYISRHTGGSWGSPVKVSGSETTGTAIGADIKSNGYGDVVAMWPDTGSKKIYMVKSTNGGSSWSSPTTVASTYGSFQMAIPADASRQVLIASIVGVYRTASTNNVYVLWNDLSGDSGCTSGGGPGTSASSSCKSRVFFQRSTDGGSTWSAKVKINNQSGKNDQFFPWMVVDETNGKIGITYYDTVGDSTRTSANVYYQSSSDGGQTWTTPLKVTTASTNETTSGADSGNQYGDYATVSGINGQFWPSWTDRRSGGKEEIWSAKVIDDGGSTCTPPAAPTGVSASSSSQTAASVSWSASSGATSYTILRSTTTGGPYSQAGTSTTTSFNDSGLSCGTTYYYVVQASNGTCSSANSAQAQATTSSCPSGGALTATYDSSLKAPSCGSTVGISCDTGASLIKGRDSISGGPETNQPNTINSSCADGTSGTFHSDESLDQLKIETTDGNTFAAGKTVKVTATVWAYSSYTADHLDLYYAASASSPSWTLIGTYTPSGSGTQTISATYTLPSGGTQAVRGVFRYNGSASSCTTGSYDDHDDLVFAVGSGCTPPAAPTGVSASSSSQTSATVSWSASSGATSYTILRSTTTGGPYTQVGTSTTTSFSDSGLSCNTTYYYVVQASNGTCSSANSAQAQATTASCPCTPPAAPTGVSATSSSQTSASVSWSASSGATSYTILRSTTTGGPYTQVGTSTTTSFSDSGLSCNTTYYYVVQASNGTCSSGNSAQAQATTASCPCTPPAAPTGVSATSSSQTSASVSWSASSGATSYTILRSTTTGGPYTQVGTSTTTSFNDSGLACNTTYYYVVQASNGTCSSGNSAQVQATTSACSGGGSALTATYDSSLKAPSCGSAVGISCDTGASLILGRDSISGGPETNQPNTINSSCTDGTSGSFHSDESLDRLKIETTDGSTFATGKTVKVTATVWAYSSYTSDHLDLYYAANASSPSWTLIGTFTPSGSGTQTISATYALPSGSSMQAVRGVFRYNGSASSCTTGSYDDHDDLVFAIDSSCTPPAAPTGVSASSSSQTSATVSWSASSGATSYIILRSTTTGGPYTQVGNSTSTSFNDSGLSCGTTYYYVVQASNGTCSSGNSAQAQATTSACSGGTNAFSNPGFESGSLSGWTASGASHTASTATVHTGTYSARLGSTSPTNGDSTISQTVTMPSGTSKVTAWYYLVCPDTVTYDWFTAILKDNTTGTTTTILGKTCTNNGAWHQITANATAGHSVTLTLTSHDDNYSGDATLTYIDDVSTQQ